MTDNDELLNEIEASAENAKVIKKVVQEKRKKKSEIPLYFEVDDSNNSLVANLIRYINGQNYTYQDLFDFCIKQVGDDESNGKRLAYNIISGLSEQRDIRASTIDQLCQFLQVDIFLGEKE